MQLLTLDASVLLKWFLKAPNEHDLPEAAAILHGLKGGHFSLVQPPHTLLEVAAVLVRERPDSITSDLADISALLDDASIHSGHVLARALGISAILNHHLFDTLYHATALETDSLLVTADRRYYDKASQLGRIVMLNEWGA